MRAHVRPFRPGDEDTLVQLWSACDLTRPWNDPGRDIERKRAWDGERLLVADVDGALIGSTMVGYDGHRGWLYYVAVHPDFRGHGFGGQLVEEATALLRELGCAKVNIQVRRSNADVVAFYERFGFLHDDVVSMGFRLEHDS